MEKIWEKYFLNASLGSSIRTIQWFKYFSCKILSSPGNTYRCLASKRPPRYVPCALGSRAQSLQSSLRTNILNCAESDYFHLTLILAVLCQSP